MRKVPKFGKTQMLKDFLRFKDNSFLISSNLPMFPFNLKVPENFKQKPPIKFEIFSMHALTIFISRNSRASHKKFSRKNGIFRYPIIFKFLISFTHLENFPKISGFWRICSTENALIN